MRNKKQFGGMVKMGCDIHLYIEHKLPEQNGWSVFGGRINPGRNYEVFDRMAGVRSYGESNAISEPRGLPIDTSYVTHGDNKLYVADKEDAVDGVIRIDENSVIRDDAERWVMQGISKYVGDKNQWVTHPDWHSHSWLSSDEFSQCVESTKILDNEYKVVVSALQCFESLGEQTRVVFWFDN